MEIESQMDSPNMLLHNAVEEDNLAVVKFLLKHGADVNSRMLLTKKLHHLGCDSSSNPEVHEIFYRYRSSSFTSCTLPANSSELPVHSSYPYIGQRNRSFSTVSEMYNHYQRQKKSPMPMHVAAANGNREIVELLLAHGGDVNAEMEGGYTPFTVAILCKHREIAETLIHQGANVNARSNSGKMPIHFAVQSRQIEMVELLLRNGGNVNARTEHGITPLHIAVERKLQDVTELLLKNGGNVNAKTKNGVTVLHCAAVKGHREITEMILNYGGDVSAIMKKGEIDVTPLLWVTDLERKKISEILYRYVAKTNTSGFYGRFFKKIWKHFTGKKN